MFFFVLKKMLKNKLMVLCLLIGSIFVVAMVSSIPIYTNGILHRMLTKDLESYQNDTGNFPGNYTVKAIFSSTYEPQDRVKMYLQYNKKIKSLAEKINLPIISKVHELSLLSFYFQPEVKEDGKKQPQAFTVSALTDFQDHIKILHGRIYSSKKVDGVTEIIVTQSAMRKLDLILNKTYIMTPPGATSSSKVKVVGVFDMKDLNDTYWYKGLGSYSMNVFMDYSLFNDEYVKTKSIYLTYSSWNYAFDYHKITLSNLNDTLSTLKQQSKWYQGYRSVLEFKMNCMDILDKYDLRQKQESQTLWVLIIPILLVLSFYIFMVSQLIIKGEQNEIAVLKSRGANRRQIFVEYLFESSILGSIAFLLGPPLGLLLCRMLGAANGFLEFVSRTGLPLSINTSSYTYALWACLFIVLTMMLPAIVASRSTIVQYKQSRSRNSGMPIWKKYCLDIVILAISVYGLYQYNKQQKILALTSIKGTDISIDPLLFLVSTFFILGSGLIFLRLYPYIIRLVFQIGKKLWSPVLYSTFIQVGRSHGQEQFLMLFIIFTLSIGIFNASSARTINKNIEDKVKYSIGADIVIQPHWETIRKTSRSASGTSAPAEISTSSDSDSVTYIEPPFEPFAKLSGISSATKVFLKDEIRVDTRDNSVADASIMGIIPNEFGKIAWFRNDLLPSHWYNYLNLIADAPKAVLVSKNFKDRFNVEPGDNLTLRWDDQNSVDVTVYAFIDYWPSYNPYTASDESATKNQFMIIGNLTYLFDRTSVQPYAIWAKKTPYATDMQIYDDIEAKALNINTITSANQSLIKKKNDPLLQGINGALTLGFIVTMMISMLGFLIYWILSIRMRVLQFGIFRAIGLSLGQVISMIIWEQILLSGTAIVVGIIIGSLTSYLFVPLLQLVYSAAEQVPPFKVIAYTGDYVKIYSIVGVMLAVGFLVLSAIISQIKIDQALKLGED